MSDFKLPELPSDEELGITEEDRKKYGDDLPDDGPEMSAAEMAALLGESPAPKRTAGGAAADPKARKKAEKAAKKARAAEAKRTAKEEKQRAKAEKQRASADTKRAKVPGQPSEIDARPAEPGLGRAEGGPGGRPDAPRPEEPAPARSQLRGPITLVLLVATAVVASTRTGLPDPVPASAPDTAFSSARAMSALVELAQAPHPTGSPEHARVRGLLLERLTGLGLEPSVQTASVVVENGDAARAATVRNIVATVPGERPTGTVLVTAHYDSRVLATGAADDGSGVVAILEAVRALLAGPPIRNDVIVLFTDAEELGLLGARAFAQHHPSMSAVDLVLSFEMRGSAGPSIMFETGPMNGWVVRTMKEWDTHPFANSMSQEVYDRMPNGTDFTVFADAGAQGLNFAAIDGAHVYHQAYDEPENLSESTLQHHGLHALGALRYYTNADLTAVDAEDVVYFTVPGLGLIVYGKLWVHVLGAVILLLLVALLGAARKGGARPLGMGMGVGLSIVCGAIVYVLSSLTVGWLRGFHEEAGSLSGSLFHAEGWYLLALGFTALAVVTATSFVLRRWFSLAELTAGAIVIPALAAVALGVVAPLAAMNLQWPVVAALVAGLVVALLGSRAEAMVGWLAALLLAVPVVLMLEPLVELVWLALRLDVVGLLGVVAALAFLLCLPALAALRHPNAWWAPLTSATIAATCVGVGLLGSGPNAERPAPSTLVYAYEHGTGDAVWATSPSADGSDAAARAWAVERAGRPFSSTRNLAAFGYFDAEVPVAEASPPDALPPALTFVVDSIFDGRRRVVLGVRSEVGAERLVFQLDDRTRLTAINGLALTDPARTRTVDHWGTPDGDVLLELTMPAEAPVGLHVVEHLLRPEALFGTGRFRRPPGLAPNDARMSDVAMLRFSVGELADPRHAVVPLAAGDRITAPPGGGIPVDSLSVRPDTLGTPPDTSGTSPDTTSAPPDGSKAPLDTMVAPPATTSRSSVRDTSRTGSR